MGYFGDCNKIGLANSECNLSAVKAHSNVCKKSVRRKRIGNIVCKGGETFEKTLGSYVRHYLHSNHFNSPIFCGR